MMTPTATRLQQRLHDRLAWLQNEWFFKWHHIGGRNVMEIDQFNGRYARYAGIKFAGSPRDIYWSTITQGVRKEIVEQFIWVEEAIKNYGQAPALQAIDQCAELLVAFSTEIRRITVEKDRILRGDGINFPDQQDLGNWRGTSDNHIRGQAEALKRALFPSKFIQYSGSSPTTLVQNLDREARNFEVALSFAGEQRTYVRKVAEALEAKGIVVFHDEFQVNVLWGKDGVEHFHEIYSRDTRYVVMFISADYVAKAWTRVERRAAISQQMISDTEYILPVRFDDTQVPGMSDTLQYLMADRFTPEELAAAIAQKIDGSSNTKRRA